jgi:hypothetical protein
MTVEEALAILKPYAENPACLKEEGYFICAPWTGPIINWRYKFLKANIREYFSYYPFYGFIPVRGLFNQLERMPSGISKEGFNLEGFVHCVVDHFKVTEGREIHVVLVHAR